MGGRGAGKTRAGAEWVRAKALGLQPLGAVARAAHRARRRDDRRCAPRDDRRRVGAACACTRRASGPRFEPSKGQLVWASGAIAQMFSAEDPDGLRGPQFDAAWCDEVAKWRHPQKTWDMLQFALRLGAAPQMVATTTPRPIPLLKKLLADAGTVVTRAATADNAANLAPTFIAEMTRRYAGSALGRQELLGELVDDTSGALWRRDWIEAQRVASAPELSAIVVAVDPPVTATAASDACGIVVAGLGPDGRAYVDRRPHAAGARAERVGARGGGGLSRLHGRPRGGRGQPGRRSRRHRAAPDRCQRGGAQGAGDARQVAARGADRGALCARAAWRTSARSRRWRIRCARSAPTGLAKGRSPDRLDALVWALTDLMIGAAGRAGHPTAVVDVVHPGSRRITRRRSPGPSASCSEASEQQDACGATLPSPWIAGSAHCAWVALAG